MIHLPLIFYILCHLIQSVRIQLRKFNLRNCIAINLRPRPINPQGNNASLDEEHYHLTFYVVLFLIHSIWEQVPNIAHNPCICQLTTGFLKTRPSSRQPRAQIHHRPASCHGGYMILSPSLHSHCVLAFLVLVCPRQSLPMTRHVTS
jgi:hypothetical protein